MPVMDGLEAATKILELNPSVPIVALTANIMTNDLEIYRKSGMKDCVGKPFTSQELWRCLLKYFTPVNWQEVHNYREVQTDEELRQKLINTFVKDNRNKFGEIKEALKSGDIKLAHRLVHSLKANAGQLDKSQLSKAAIDVEQALASHLEPGEGLSSGKNAVSPEQLAALETELNAALAEFAPLVAEPIQTEAQSGAGDQNAASGAKSMRKMLEKLQDMLERGNPECRDLIGDLRQLPKTEKLIRQMEDLDFEPALESLAKIKKQYNE